MELGNWCRDWQPRRKQSAWTRLVTAIGVLLVAFVACGTSSTAMAQLVEVIR